MSDVVSVILPTYNPDRGRLGQALDGLRQQTLSYELWELIIIDNNSSPAVSLDINWPVNYKIISQPVPGLTHARLKGFEEAMGSIIIMVDDDNVLDNSYLKNALSILQTNTRLGAIGGISVPLFEGTAPEWLAEFYEALALRDLGDQNLISTWENTYPPAAPIGAGMAIRKAALTSYINNARIGNSAISDRTGNSLSSSGDNEIVIEILKSGWQVGYFPALKLQHIIPAKRMQADYLGRLLNDTNKSWQQLLHKHHINPWSSIATWSVLPRKIKSWFTYRAWKGPVNYIKWRGACGFFEGLAKR